MSSFSISAPTDRRNIDWTRATWYLLGLTLLLRVGYLLIFPMDLAGDESYYWDWSRQPDWSYYSKPPLVAWVIWLGTLPGDTLFFLKLPAALLNVAGIGVLTLLARRLYSPKTGFWTALISVTMPGTAVGGMTMTIDAPLLFCWGLALWFVWGALDPQASPASQKRHGVGAVAAVGTGLLAKLSMGVFWISLLFLRLFPGKTGPRPTLTRWIPLALASALFLIPFLLWNWQRDWITFEHTSTSFGVDDRWTFSEAFGKGLEFLGSQLGALNPVWWIAMLLIGALCLAKWKQLDARARFLTAFSTPLIFGSILLSFYQRVQPNWPAAFYLSATILLAVWLCGESLGFTSRTPDQGKPVWRKTGLILGVFMIVFVYLAPYGWELTGYAGHRSDPFARIRGWKAFAAEVQQSRTATFHDQPHFLWVAGHRYPVSQLAFYLPDQPRVYRYDPSGYIWSQYEMWPDPAESGLAGQDALLLLPPELLESQLPEWSQHFENVTPAGQVVYEIGHGRKLHMLAFRGERLKPKEAR